MWKHEYGGEGVGDRTGRDTHNNIFKKLLLAPIFKWKPLTKVTESCSPLLYVKLPYNFLLWILLIFLLRWVLILKTALKCEYLALLALSKKETKSPKPNPNRGLHIQLSLRGSSHIHCSDYYLDTGNRRTCNPWNSWHLKHWFFLCFELVTPWSLCLACKPGFHWNLTSWSLLLQPRFSSAIQKCAVSVLRTLN